MPENLSHFKDPHFIRSLLLSLGLLIASLFINFYAGIYATEKASNSVTDIILSNTHAYNLDEFFVYGSWIMVAVIAVVCFKYARKAPFAIKSIALFVLIRAIFITLTHIGPFPGEMVLNPKSFLNFFVFGGDLFFSGHTGLPFLMALVFWNEIWLRRIFIAGSIAFAIIVLLAHLHYTIDVASAYFITYGIFHIAVKWFKKDYQYFLSEEKKS